MYCCSKRWWVETYATEYNMIPLISTYITYNNSSYVGQNGEWLGVISETSKTNKVVTTIRITKTPIRGAPKLKKINSRNPITMAGANLQ